VKYLRLRPRCRENGNHRNKYRATTALSYFPTFPPQIGVRNHRSSPEIAKLLREEAQHPTRITFIYFHTSSKGGEKAGPGIKILCIGGRESTTSITIPAKFPGCLATSAFGINQMS